MISHSYALILVLIMAVVTFATRAVSFVLFPEGRTPPQLITYLSGVLPCAVMGMLVVFCLKNISFTAASRFLPELISVAVVAGLHIWKKNTLLSIIVGTACYMVLIRVMGAI